jgi:hypothetical protein
MLIIAKADAVNFNDFMMDPFQRPTHRAPARRRRLHLKKGALKAPAQPAGVWASIPTMPLMWKLECKRQVRDANTTLL